MTVAEFIAKWRHVDLTERASSHTHFNDLCRLVEHEDPVSADPQGTWFTFERGAAKATGGPGYDEETVGFHVFLMKDGELVTAQEVTAFGDEMPTAKPGTITWKGYEFLEAARRSVAWNRVVGLTKEAGNSSFKTILEVLSKIAVDAVFKQIGQP